jgi:hypothetical protein
MSVFESVFKISQEILENSKHVTIDIDYINGEGKELITKSNDTTLVKKFQPDQLTLRKTILKELTLDAINYCYWFGSSNYRPNGASASVAMRLANESFTDYCRDDPACDDLSTCLDKFKMSLLENRFTLLTERFLHIEEVAVEGEAMSDAIFLFLDKKVTFDFLVENLLWYFPGFASDLFLKRASLFFMGLYRETGIFENELKQLPVPADYQVPKKLKHFGFIKYSEELMNLINNDIIIPKGSRYEVEIRAATVLACQAICEATGWNSSDVDMWFWGKRDLTTDPFHLTITTDY